MSLISLFLSMLLFGLAVVWTFRPAARQAFDEASCLALDEPERSRCLRKAKRGDGPHLDRLAS